MILTQFLKLTSTCDYKSLSSFIYDKKYSGNEGRPIRNVFEYTMNHFNEDISIIAISEVANMQKRIFYTEIAECSGFSKILNFNRQFKSAVGITPLSYRKNNT
ncbi:MAG: hypothetical protein WA749_13215 [Gelidibacter sp.]